MSVDIRKGPGPCTFEQFRILFLLYIYLKYLEPGYRLFFETVVHNF